MTNQEKKVPELRFPEFDGEWDITTIEKIAKVSKGFTPSTKDINLWQNDNKNWLSIAGMSDKYIYEGNKGISSAGEGKHKKVNKDTLIMSFKLTLGKLAIVKTPIYTNEAICHFEWKTNQLKTEYMYYYLSFINIKSFGAQAVKGITLNNDSINSILIKLPGFLEQEKIGTFFSKLDQQIELEEKKLAKLEEQKKGYMQKIFSQELRFKDEKGNDYPEWDITTIEKIAKVSKGFTPSTKDINLWQNDNKNWLSIAGMSDKYIYEGNKGISSAGEGKHKKVNKDTLIMSFKLTLGKLAIVKTPIYTNEAICHFEWKTNQLKTEYMYYYLSFINIKSFGAQAVKGITLNNDSINSILIKLPGFLEQNKISNFFTKFDELIEKQNQRIDGLKKRKKGFLQKMFV